MTPKENLPEEDDKSTQLLEEICDNISRFKTSYYVEGKKDQYNQTLCFKNGRWLLTNPNLKQAGYSILMLNMLWTAYSLNYIGMDGIDIVFYP